MSESTLTDTQIQQLKQSLLAKGAEINERMTKLLGGSSSVEGVDGESSFTGGTQLETLQGFMAAVQARLRAIRNASYGTCAACSQPIPFEGLAPQPWRARCEGCA